MANGNAAGALLTVGAHLVPTNSVVRGQIYFAWVDEDDEFDPAVHNVFDENVFSFELSQEEGDFAALSVGIKNPRIGLLNPARKVWCYFSIFNGAAVVPLFKGRLIGVPTNVFATLVTLAFTARPSDFAAQKAALAQSMKVLPYYDSIFVSPDSWTDPDVVLEAYSRLWHVHPVTHVVTASDILIGEDGAEIIGEDEHAYEEMDLTLNQTPLRAVQMVATIPWSQSGEGAVDLTPIVRGLFAGPMITSFTMSGLIADWPKGGSDFGPGWKVSQGSQLLDVSAGRPVAKIEDIFSWQGTVPIIPEGSVVYPIKVEGEYHTLGETAGFNFQFELVIAGLGFAVPSLGASWVRNSELAQVVTFTLFSDQQAIVTLPGDEEFEVITLSGNKVSDPTEDLSVPIGNVLRRDYVHSPRGMQSVEHLLLVARAHLIARSRAVEVGVDMIDFIDALRLQNLRKNAEVQDHRLPGGTADGKIIGYNFSLDGDNGTPTAKIKIASCVGKGGSHTAVDGNPTYVDDWVDGWQEYTDAVVLTDTADIAWTMPPFVGFDDGLDFEAGLTAENVVELATVSNTSDVQEGFLHGLVDQAQVSTVLKEHPTQITMRMTPTEGGPFNQEVVIDVSDLIVPKQIDLEAPSNA